MHGGGVGDGGRGGAPPDDGATLDDGPQEVRARFPGLRVDRRIAAGGSGVVFRAWSEARGEWVALKVLRAGRWASELQRRRFRREVDVHRRLDDPGVVRIFEDGTSDDGAPWLTMELVDGPSLQGLLDTGALPPIRERVAWVATLARTLARLHARGVFHRDVKPSNVLLAEGREPRLADFGIVVTEEESRLTVGSRAVGTPRFMAPEQVTGEVLDWARVDVYALGLVLAELVGRRRDGSTRTVELGDAPADLRFVVARATAEAPASRYATIAELADDLDRWRTGRPVRWRPGAVAWSAREGLRRRVSVTALLAVVTLGVVVGVGAVRWVEVRRADAAAADWVGARDRLDALWAAGDPAGAEAWVRSFTEDPARHGAPTLGVAWLDLAALQRGARATDDEIASLGRALAATRDPTVRARAVAELVDAYRRTRAWAALDRLLRAELPVAIDPALRRDATVDVALAAGDVPAALALLPADDAARLAPFTQLHAFPNTVRSGVDTDGDGRVEWVENTPGLAAPVRDGDRWRVPMSVRSTARLADGRVLAIGGPDLWALGPGEARRFGPGLARLVELDGRLFGVPPTQPRALVELVDGALVPAPGPARLLASYVTGLAVGDADGDGASELVTTWGPPNGFLVRVERMAGAEATTLGEARLGFVSGAVVLGGARPRLLASVSHENPSAHLFGTEDPYGGPCRLVSLRLDGGALVEEQTVRWAAPTCNARNLYLADLDGDGTSEVLLNLENAEVVVLRQGPDGDLARAFVVPGFHIMEVLQADADPAHELLLEQRGMPVAERRHWVVGAEGLADATLPRPEWPAPAIEAADGVTDLFQRLSLDAQAAASAEQRGELAAAARLWVRAGERGRAAAARAEEARRNTDADALADAVSLALQHPDPALAGTVVAAAAAVAPPTATATDARLRAALAPDWAADLSRTLDARLERPLPVAVRHDLTTAELQLTVPGGVGPVLRLPLRTTGAPPWIHVAGDWIRAEWGSALDIAVRPVGAPDARGVGLRLEGKGAGGVLFRAARLLLHPTPHVSLLRNGEPSNGGRARVATADAVTAFDLRIGGTGDPATVAVLGSSDGRAVSASGPSGEIPAAGEAWELVVAGGQGWDAPPGLLAAVRLRRLEIGGFTVEETPAPALDPLVAWAERVGPPPAPPSPDDPRILGLLRLDPAVFERAAGAWGRATADALFAATWETAAYAHRADPRTLEALLSWTPAAWDPRWLGVRVAHAEALVRVGRVAEAREELLACWEVARADGDRWRWALDAAVLLGELALADGDEAAARGWAADAIAVAPDADLGRRFVRNRPRYAAVVGRAGWEFLADGPAR